MLCIALKSCLHALHFRNIYFIHVTLHLSRPTCMIYIILGRETLPTLKAAHAEIVRPANWILMAYRKPLECLLSMNIISASLFTMLTPSWIGNMVQERNSFHYCSAEVLGEKGKHFVFHFLPNVCLLYNMYVLYRPKAIDGTLHATYL